MERTVAQGRVIPITAGRSRPAYEFEIASSENDEDVRRLLRENPLGGSVQISLECEPLFQYAAGVQGDRNHTIIARDSKTGRVVAMGSRSVSDVYVNGAVQRLGYLSQLRVDRTHRHRPRLVRDGYALARSLREPDELPFDITCLMVENRTSRRLLTAGVRGLPRYVALGQFSTLAIRTRAARRPLRGKFQIERGSPRRLAEIVDCLNRNNRRFQFAPHWRAEDLLSTERCRGLALSDFLLAICDDRVVGCAALWNQQSFKQIVIRGYSPAVARWRPLLNTISPWLGQPSLPPVRNRMNVVHLSHFAVDSDDAAVAIAIVESARDLSQDTPDALLLLGLGIQHPMLAPLRVAFRHRAWISEVHAVDWDQNLDLADVSSRPIHLEAATL